MVAALLIGVSDGIISVFFSPTLAKIIATLAVALVLVFRPQGLFGTTAAMNDTPAQGDRAACRRSSRCCSRLNFVLPDYHHGVLARVMVLAVFAMGYNLLFGYAGLLSLGHAMFFAAGLYGAGAGDVPSRLGRAGGLRSPGWSAGVAAFARHRPAGAAHHRRRLHDRHLMFAQAALPH